MSDPVRSAPAASCRTCSHGCKGVRTPDPHPPDSGRQPRRCEARYHRAAAGACGKLAMTDCSVHDQPSPRVDAVSLLANRCTARRSGVPLVPLRVTVNWSCSREQWQSGRSRATR
ncbi:conserved hypothetical protein [Ricinus communis]|uniref:Uncharacterized protein n=1 Tax=Ricinus communis TaxID=3988 RepID=B9T965_RICCO|nr:conserved hypothetical protein [Ricinus communis]